MKTSDGNAKSDTELQNRDFGLLASNLQQKSQWLIHTLEAGEIPIYLDGEHRE